MSPLIALSRRAPKGARRVEPEEVQNFLRQLPDMNVEDLRAVWRERFGDADPPIRSGDVLRRLTAWRMQAAVYGGYTPETAKALTKLMSDHQATRLLGTPLKPKLGTGTVLTREWKGRLHHVTVEAKGFAYEGRAYRSLSEIARLITGTRWSGPRLFGLEGP